MVLLHRKTVGGPRNPPSPLASFSPTSTYRSFSAFQNESAVESLEILAGDVVAEATPAPSASVTEAPVVTAAPVAPPVGDTLESPPELQWTLNEATGVLAGEIEMDVVTIDNFYGRTTTRGFNGQVCVFGGPFRRFGLL